MKGRMGVSRGSNIVPEGEEWMHGWAAPIDIERDGELLWEPRAITITSFGPPPPVDWLRNWDGVPQPQVLHAAYSQAHPRHCSSPHASALTLALAGYSPGGSETTRRSRAIHWRQELSAEPVGCPPPPMHIQAHPSSTSSSQRPLDSSRAEVVELNPPLDRLAHFEVQRMESEHQDTPPQTRGPLIRDTGIERGVQAGAHERESGRGGREERARENRAEFGFGFGEGEWRNGDLHRGCDLNFIYEASPSIRMRIGESASTQPDHVSPISTFSCGLLVRGALDTYPTPTRHGRGNEDHGLNAKACYVCPRPSD
ncbi:hypothetical protein FIBSPDRAFT_987114 [Athelia psychrophila]|uniref:Uncharacterized protein n=1 Tax=Athelia psychrophila TaxID=1759441 RepID=A0A166SQ42_9AGAM|nr:hypothetical protein FIBSPDRAFT_987114 [Fibularhizoctonia sp. CBS 109695]